MADIEIKLDPHTFNYTINYTAQIKLIHQEAKSLTKEVYLGFRMSLYERPKYIPIVCFRAQNKNKEPEWQILSSKRTTAMELLRQFLHKELF